MNYKKNTKPKDLNKKMGKRDNIESLFAFFEVGEKVLDAFISKTFPLPPTKDTGLKILPPTQMLQRLPTPTAKVKTGSTSENLLNEICQIIYYFIEQMKLLNKSIHQYNELI